jgi:hypothetical protein
MFDGSRCQRFLTKARDQHWIVSNEVRKDDFDCVLGLEKDVAGLKNNTHSALTQAPLELITSIQNGIAK